MRWVQLKIVASREPCFWLRSTICIQLPSAYCYLSSLSRRKLELNWLWKGKSPVMFKANLKNNNLLARSDTQTGRMCLARVGSSTLARLARSTSICFISPSSSFPQSGAPTPSALGPTLGVQSGRLPIWESGTAEGNLTKLIASSKLSYNLSLIILCGQR